MGRDKKTKKQLHQCGHVISLPKLCFSTSLRSHRTQKTGLAQHANHQAFRTQTWTLTPQNDPEKQKRQRENST